MIDMTQSHSSYRLRPPEGMIGTHDAMRITGLSRITVCKHARAGNIPGAIKRQNAWFFTETGLHSFLTSDAA